MAAQIRLGWDKNKEPNVVGYKVYCRLAHEDFDYDKPAWFGPGNSCVIDNLDDDTNYYFVVRAFTIAGEESDDSDEAEYDNEAEYDIMGNINMNYGDAGNAFSAMTGGGGNGPQAGNGCFVGSAYL